MLRLMLLVAGAGILIFGLLMGLLLVFCQVLPTKQLSYVSIEHNRSAIFLLDYYHRIQVELIKDAYTPAWSPDGTRLAFYSTRDHGRDLYIMDIFGQQIQRLTHNGANNSSPSWSPDGREIAFASDYADAFAIYTIPVDCRDTFEHCAKRLTPDDHFWYAAPAWSPDGERITFVTTKDTTNAFDDSLGNSNIYIMNRDGTNIQQLTDNLGDDYTPAWSPDSRNLVYSAQNIRFGRIELMVRDTQCNSGVNCTRLLFSDIVDIMPSWSPDGSSIVFVDARDGSFEMYTTDTEGRYLQRLTYNQSDESSPRWRP
jgi:Tol biopolymer transport system component